jgi:DNA-binding FrmR family transcriptional regulator
MHVESREQRERIDRRLSRVEGQIRGIRRMLDEERDCREVMQQLSAARAAVHEAGLDLMRVYASQCLRESDGRASEEETLDYIVGTLGKWA